MNASMHSARNGPRWFITAIAIAGLVASATASPPLAEESVAIPKAGLVVKNDSGQKLQAANNDSPGTAYAVSANQQVSQFDVANYAVGGVISYANPLAKIASDNNGVTDVVAVIYSLPGSSGTSDIDHPVANAVTSLNTSPPPAAVGRLALANIACVNSEGGVGYGTTLVVTSTYPDQVLVSSQPPAIAIAA